MSSLGFLSNPTRQEVIASYLQTTLYRAGQNFIDSHAIYSDRQKVRFYIKLMRENGVLPVCHPCKRKPKSPDLKNRFLVSDFIHKYDHNKAMKIIGTDLAFDEKRNEALAVYADFIGYLNQYLKDLLKSYHYEYAGESGSMQDA